MLKLFLIIIGSILTVSIISVSGACKKSISPCNYSSDCCSFDQCVNGKCVSHSCKHINEVCTSTFNCCGNDTVCLNKICTTDCLQINEMCENSYVCCGGNACINKKCENSEEKWKKAFDLL